MTRTPRLTSIKQPKDGLSPRHQALLDMLIQEQLTVPELAQKLHVSPGTIRTYLSEIARTYQVFSVKAYPKTSYWSSGEKVAENHQPTSCRHTPEHP